jgi:hypothetical protein
VALGGGTRESYGEVAFGGAVHGVAIGSSYFDTDGGGCLVSRLRVELWGRRGLVCNRCWQPCSVGCGCRRGHGKDWW